jgi:hypothetical protein
MKTKVIILLIFCFACNNITKKNIVKVEPRDSIANEYDGKLLYQSYCVSCHKGVAKNAYLNNFDQGPNDLFQKINSSKHPVKFENLDSIQMVYLIDYFNAGRHGEL